MATLSIISAVSTSSGRTLLLKFATPTANDTWPTYNGGVTVTVNGSSATYKVNTAVGWSAADPTWRLYISLDSFLLPTDVVTVAGTTGMLTAPVGDTTASFGGFSCVNNSNRQADLYDTFCAHFNETPWRYITTSRKIGVVTFDNVFGNVTVDRVEFDINGGGYSAITDMAWNIDNAHSTIAPLGVWEYFIPVNPFLYPDGTKITVTARIYPSSGSATYKQISINLWANSGGTLDSTVIYIATTGSDTTGDGSSGNPFRNVEKALTYLYGLGTHGGRIEIKDTGSYQLPFSGTGVLFKGFVRIQAAAALTEANIIFFPEAGHDSTVNMGCNRIHFKGGFTFDWSQLKQMTVTANSGAGDFSGYVTWHDGNYFNNTGGTFNSIRWATGANTFDWSESGVHCVNCTMERAVYGFASIQRSLNCTVTNQQADIQSNTVMTVNLVVRQGIALGTAGPHGDCFQMFNNSLRGVIVYGIYFKDAVGYQGMYWTDLFDHIGVAIVNHGGNIKYESGGAQITQLRSVMENILMMNVTLATQAWSCRSDWNPYGTFIIANSVAASLDAYNQSVLSGITIVSSHFITGTVWGANPSTGSLTVQFTTGTTNIGYGGPGNRACKIGFNYLKWRHPGVLNDNGTPRRGAFDVSGTPAEDLGGEVRPKPSICILNTQNSIAPTFRSLWAFDNNDRYNFQSGNGFISGANITGSYLSGIPGQTSGTWVDSSYGLAVRAPRFRASGTQANSYPFQLVAAYVDDGSNNSASVPYFYGGAGFTTRFYGIKNTPYFASGTALQSRFGTETGSAMSVTGGQNKMVVAVAQFVSDSDRKLWMFIDGNFTGYATDTATVSTITSDRESIGGVDGSSFGSVFQGDMLMAGRTTGLWNGAQVSGFGQDPFLLFIPPPITPTGLTVTPQGYDVYISWAAISGVNGYSLYRNSDLIYDGTATSIANLGLMAGTYSYVIAAYNDSGPSSQSAPVSGIIPGGYIYRQVRLGSNIKLKGQSVVLYSF